MKTIIIVILLVCSIFTAYVGAVDCTDPSMEINTDRTGMDYENFELENPNPCECRDACFKDSKCLAYTYVKPGIQSRKAWCWLKNGVPDQVYDINCISGLKLQVVGIPAGCNSILPDPIISYEDSKNYTGSDGNKYTMYSLAITNYDEYSSDLFVASPDLPPCGKNINSSRTWVNIYDNSEIYLYGFCAINSPSELQKLWFSVPYGTSPPPSVTVELYDRLCDRRSSASVIIPVYYAINLPGQGSDFIVEPVDEKTGTENSSYKIDPSDFIGVHPIPIP